MQYDVYNGLKSSGGVYAGMQCSAMPQTILCYLILILVSFFFFLNPPQGNFRHQQSTTSHPAENKCLS